MTEKFIKAMPYIFQHEGGYNDVKGDAGGATNYGVSLTFLKSINEDINHDGKVDALDIKSLTKDTAEDIYFHNFWKPSYDMIQEKIAIKVFDVAVNAGAQRAHILLQRALNALGENLEDDGMMGRNTINACLKYKEKDILDKYCAVQLSFYKAIVAKNPTQKKFLAGWTNRAAFKPK